MTGSRNSLIRDAPASICRAPSLAGVAASLSPLCIAHGTARPSHFLLFRPDMILPDGEGRLESWHDRSRLPVSNAQAIIAGCGDAYSIFIHHAQVTRCEVNSDVARRSL